MTDNTLIAAVPAQESLASQSRTLVRLASHLEDKHGIDKNLYRDHLSFALAVRRRKCVTTYEGNV